MKTDRSSELPRRGFPGALLRCAAWGRKSGASWGALMACLGGTVLATLITAAQERAREEVRFRSQADRYQNIIGERVNTYVQVLKGAVGLFSASEFVQRDEWRAYFQQLDLSGRYRGLRVLGYVEHVWKTNLPSFLTRIREEKSRYYDAAADFHVRSAGSASDCYVVKYVEPMEENQGSLGYDIGSDPVERQAADEACDTGEATLTRLIYLVQAPQSPGAMLLLPVFCNGTHPTNASQRRACLQGWVDAAFVLKDLMAGLHELAGLQVNVEIFDGTLAAPETLLYTDAEGPGKHGRPARAGSSLNHRAALTVGRHVWTLHFTAGPAFAGEAGGSLPRLVFAGGSLISLLVFGITRSLRVSQQRTVALANQMTERLRLQERAMLSSNDGLFILDARREDHRIIYTNPAFVDMTGYSLEDGLGQDTATLERSDAPRFNLMRFRAALKAGSPNPTVLHECRKDGTPLWAELRLSPVHDDHGQITHLLGVLQDITERKRAEDELVRTQRWHQELMDNLSVGVYRNTPGADGRFLEANPAMVAMFEAGSKEEFLRHRVSELHVDPARRVDFSEKLTRTGGAWHEALELKTLKGRRFWASITAVRRVDEAGNPFFDGVIEDITQQKAAADILQRERILLRTVLDNLPDAIYAKDAQCSKTLANRADLRIMGCATEAEALGKTDFEFYPKELASALFADDHAVIQTGQPILDRHECFVDGQGRSRWLLTSKLPLHDESGRIVGLVGIGRDITKLKLTEEALRENQQELQRSLEQLRASKEELEKTQLQLIQAAKMESIGSLAAGVAHEVKNPLQTILMGVEFLSSNLPSADGMVALALGDMREAVKRANGIVGELLQLSAVTSLEFQEEDFNEVVERSLWLVNHELVAKQTEVVRHLQVPLPRVRIDRQRIEQVLINLFINALQAMAPTGTLSVTTRSGCLGGDLVLANGSGHFLPPGERVVIAEVRDTGPGISETHLARLFDPFFTTKPVGVGTGLGLSVVKKIMDLHEGLIDIKNVAEGGALVTLVLRAQ